MRLSKLTICVASRLFNWHRLLRLPGHRRRVRQARRALGTVRAIRGTAAEARQFSYLRKVEPLVFEELVLCAIEQAGMFVVRNLRYSGDGGIDGRAWHPGIGWCGIQVKRYAAHISHGHLNEFASALARSGHSHGYFVHCGRTGAAAYEHFTGRRISQLSGQRLLDLLCSGSMPAP